MNLVKHQMERNENVVDDDKDERSVLPTAIIPYTKHLSEQIRRVLRGHNIHTVFRLGQSLGTKVKDPIYAARASACVDVFSLVRQAGTSAQG